MKKLLFNLFSFALLSLSIFPGQTYAAATIVIDPGHSGSDISLTDPATGLLDHDYPNPPEDTEVWNVSQELKKQLEAAGFTVVMTKNSILDTVSLRKRADIANGSQAALVVSIHDDRGQSFGSWAQIYTQKVGLFRTKSNGTQVTFSDANTATKSQDYGSAIVEERIKAEGRNVANINADFNGRPGLAAGNIPLVMLFANVPWVYNEVGARGGLNATQSKQYATGIANGIKKANPVSGGTTGGSRKSSATACLIIEVGKPNEKPIIPPECTMQAGSGAPGAQEAIRLARANVQKTYVWGAPSRNWASLDPNTNPPAHFDCSGFVGWAWYWGSGGKVSMHGQTNADWNDATGKYQKFLKDKVAEIQQGDLVYFGTVSSTHHVGMYVGSGSCGKNDCFIHEYSTGKPGTEASLGNRTDFVGFLRPMFK